MLYIGNKKVKVYIGDKKVKKGYIGNVLCYSSGNPVTYHVDTSTIYTEEVEDGATCLSPTTFTPAKSGYTFKGWREDSTANSSVLSSKVMGDSPITLYAVFQKNVTVTKYNGSTSATTETKQQYYNNGNVANPSFTLSQTAVSGWTVRGWSTSTTANASATVSNGGSVTLSANATYYGLYQATITLSYNGNGATSGSTAAQTGTRYWNSAGNYSNPSFTLRANGFARTNYTFQKWAQGSASGTQYNAGAAITLNANTTFYAVWTESSGVVTFTNLGAYMHHAYTGTEVGHWLQYSSSTYFDTGYANPIGTNSGTAVIAYPSSGMIRVRCQEAVSRLTFTCTYGCQSLDALCSIRMWVSKNGDKTNQILYASGDIGTTKSGNVNYTFTNLSAGDLIGLIGWAGESDSDRRWSINITNAKFEYTI